MTKNEIIDRLDDLRATAHADDADRIGGIIRDIEDGYDLPAEYYIANYDTKIAVRALLAQL